LRCKAAGCHSKDEIMSRYQIERETNGAHGRYVARMAGHDGEAELLFTRRGPDLISADHAEAPMSLRGTGIARALIERMVDDARRDGFRIIPRCGYVRAQARKHPAWSDVMTSGD
jgi:hypothetical protein